MALALPQSSQKPVRDNRLLIALTLVTLGVAFLLYQQRPIASRAAPASSRALAVQTPAQPLAYYARANISTSMADSALKGPAQNLAMESSTTPQNAAAPAAPDAATDRKMVRSGSLDLIVKDPTAAAGKVGQFAGQLGGYVVMSEVNRSADSPYASVTLRVPVARLEQAREQIRSLGVRVESEKLAADDVTHRYVDLEARLRNLRATEIQYLSILKNARTIEDTLAVTEKLDNVRGEIEQQQAEFATLSSQVETVVLTVSLRAEADAQVLGLHWRPLYQLKLAVRDGLDGLANYSASMVTFLLFLPTALLWMASVFAGIFLSWKLLRWLARKCFGWEINRSPTRAAQGESTT